MEEDRKMSILIEEDRKIQNEDRKYFDKDTYPFVEEQYPDKYECDWCCSIVPYSTTSTLIYSKNKLRYMVCPDCRKEIL